jgi:hypothetical protein
MMSQPYPPQDPHYLPQHPQPYYQQMPSPPPPHYPPPQPYYQQVPSPPSHPQPRRRRARGWWIAAVVIAAVGLVIVFVAVGLGARTTTVTVNGHTVDVPAPGADCVQANDDGTRYQYGASLNARVVTADGSIKDWTVPYAAVERSQGEQFRTAWACP